MQLRSHIFQEKILDPIRLYASFLVSLFFVMVLVRCFEMLVVFFYHGVDLAKIPLCLNGFLNDLWFTLMLGGICYPLFWLAFLILKPMSEFYSRTVLLVILFAYMAIDKYFLEALTPLAADFWAYSYADLATTIRSSTEFSLTDTLAFLLLPLLILAIYNRLIKIYIVHPIYPVLTVLLIVTAFVYPNLVTKSIDDFESETDYHLTQNKAQYFVNKSLTYFAEKKNSAMLSEPQFQVNPHPFLHAFNEPDELSQHLNLGNKPPNFVFILVESLGRAFTGPGAAHAGFTPFLDSLSAQSLYWENCISPTGRTFGILPNVFGSLPFGTNGFNALGDDMPQHITLLSEAKKLDYNTHYFYGGNVGFDDQRDFLEQQGVDYILGQSKFPKQYAKMPANSGGFSWGYADKDVFKLAQKTLARSADKPRIDVYMTLVNHEPFKVPESEYHKKFKDQLKALPKANAAFFTQYQNIFECLLYTDDAIRDLINAYRKRPDFNNTIFIITGDHRMIPIEHRNALDRFHVPLIIWSPMLKQQRQMKALVSHSQIAPTLLSMLRNTYQLNLPKEVAFINSGLSFDTEFTTTLSQPIMKNKGDLNLIVHNNYFLDNGILYKILPRLELDKTGFRIRKTELQNRLDEFKKANRFVTLNNALYPSTIGLRKAKDSYHFNDDELHFLDQLEAGSLGSDSLLTIAQNLFKSDQYTQAKTVLRYTLNRSPTYADVRILLGRIHYWEDNDSLAIKELTLAVKHSPLYSEAYFALGSILAKTKNHKPLNSLMDSAMQIEPSNPQYLYFKALGYSAHNTAENTKTMVDSLLQLSPGNQDLKDFKATL